MTERPRLPPLPPGDWPEEMAEALAALQPPNPRHERPPRDPNRPKGLNILGTFAHHPALTRAYYTFNGHILFATTLSPRQRELLVLRVAHRRRCEYEWLQHVLLGRDAGLTDDEIDRITRGPDAEGWTDEERALISAVDELLADARLHDFTWATLSALLDTQQLLDLVFTVGAYDTVAMAMLTFAVAPDEDLHTLRKRPSP